MKKQLLLFAWALIFAGTLNQAQALLIDGEILWTGDAGWKVDVDFRFEYGVKEIHGNYGDGDYINGLYGLTVNIYNPQGEHVFEVQSVEPDGRNRYSYLQFYFNGRTLRFRDDKPFDVGYDPGYWFTEDQLTFTGYVVPPPDPEYPDPPGYEPEPIFGDYTIDSGGNKTLTFSVIPPASVPDGGSTALMFGAAALGMGGMKRRKGPHKGP